jgi:hypothetical protein
MRNAIFKVGTASLVFCVQLGGPKVASAKQPYYDAISSATGTCLDCRLCHVNPTGGGVPDASKPFLLTMASTQRFGQAPPADTDSDKDGFKDLDELENQGDPNDPMVGPGEAKCPEVADYGCIGSKPGSGGAEPQASASAAASSIAGVRARFPALLMALATALVLGRRLFMQRG